MLSRPHLAAKAKMIRTIFLDESGYTGINLLDDGQPLFVLASLALEPTEADELKEEYFGSIAANELKHSQLKRRPGQRVQVLRFLDHLTASPDLAKIWIADKRFAGWVKVVDFIVEPFLEARGINLYKDGANQATATVLHKALPAFTSTDFADRVLVLALKLIKFGKEDNRLALVKFLQSGRRNFPSRDARELLDMLILPLRQLPPSEFEDMPVGAADFALAAAVQLMGCWQTHLRNPLRVVHDRTANMARQRPVWDALTSNDMPAFVQTTASGMTHTYPVGVVETVFAASEAHSGLQLADVLAGAIGSCTDTTSGDDNTKYALSVLDRLNSLRVHALMPPDDISPAGMNTLGLDSEPGHRYLVEQFTNGRVPTPERHGKDDAK